jgi:hypothetical protein
MIYNPGMLHETLQKSYYYQVGFDFTMTICGEGVRYNDLREVNDYDTMTGPLNTDVGDIIKFKWFKPKPDHNVYIFIESIERKGKIIQLNRETIMSLDFLERNVKNGLFTNVTKIFERDNKINQIIN